MGQKKILVTYFENYGFVSNNKLCRNIIDELHKALKEESAFLTYLPLKTKRIIPSNLDKESEKRLKEELENTYEYIISIGLCDSGEKCVVERIKQEDNVYLFGPNKLFKFNYIPKGKGLGACYRVRDYIIQAAVENKESKVDFLHIVKKYKKTPNDITTFLINQIKLLIKHI